ncbi:MAG: NAD-binding protein [Deltaproteobacteria bacterium]
MRIIVAGCGRVGSGLARALALRRHHVTVVDTDPGAFRRLGKQFPGTVATGSAVDREILAAAGADRADGVASATGSDEVNVACARLALHTFHVPKVVARIHDPLKEEEYRKHGIQTVTPVAWGIHRMADLLCHSRLDAVASLGSGEVDIVETEVPNLLAGRAVAELRVPGEVRVVAITRHGRTFLPVEGATFAKGDRLHIAVLGSSAHRLESLLGHR